MEAVGTDTIGLMMLHTWGEIALSLSLHVAISAYNRLQPYVPYLP